MDPRVLGTMNLLIAELAKMNRTLDRIATALDKPPSAGDRVDAEATYQTGRADMLAELALMTPRRRTDALSRARHPSASAAEPFPVIHTEMRAHDGWAPHSHEVRPDHRGVPRTEEDS